MKLEPNLIPLFLAVAEEHNFRAAADRLGVTRSAISQGMKRLEDTLGVLLVNRTTRSIHLTEAGAQLHRSLAKPWAEITSGLEMVTGNLAPKGLLRLAVTSIAEPFLSGPLIAAFAVANPGVTVDVTVTDEELDIVAEGFDGGIRLGDVIEQDMIAVPVGPRRQREAVVASPDYIAVRGTPAHPRDLVDHRCIGWRPRPGTAP